jgi:hypothetical protein
VLRCAPTCMAEGAALKGVDGVVFPGIDISDRYLQKGKSLLYSRSSGRMNPRERIIIRNASDGPHTLPVQACMYSASMLHELNSKDPIRSRQEVLGLAKHQLTSAF